MVVPAPLLNLARPVELLQKYETTQLMRECHVTQSDGTFHSAPDGIGDAICAAEDEREGRAPVARFPKERCKLRRCEFLPVFIKQPWLALETLKRMNDLLTLLLSLFLRIFIAAGGKFYQFKLQMMAQTRDVVFAAIGSPRGFYFADGEEGEVVHGKQGSGVEGWDIE